MSDNRDNSSDSRYWGFVPRENIVGTPWVVYWSYDAPTEELMECKFRPKATNYFVTNVTPVGLVTLPICNWIEWVPAANCGTVKFTCKSASTWEGEPPA